jgi:hypothetical protein
MVKFAPGEAYFRFDPATGEATPIAEERAHLLGRGNIDCYPEAAFVVRARDRQEAHDIAQAWRAGGGRGEGLRRGELPGERGSFYFVLRD